MKMYINKLTVVVLFSTAVISVKAQQTSPVADTAAPVLVTVEKTDSRMDELMDKKILIVKSGNGKLTSTKTVLVDRYGRINMPGFRLQVINSTDRSLVYSTKARLYQQFPGQKQYVIAQAPFFKLRFGNFTTKEEAERYKKMLSPMFPNGVYIVSDVIESRVNIQQKKVVEVKTNPKDSNK